MGGGRAMATAAKVAGIGVSKGGLRGGFQAPSPATEQLMVKSTAVSASISSVAHPESMITHRPLWDDWEFAEEEPIPIPRVVFSKPPSLQEAKEATHDLKEAIHMVYNKSSSSSGSHEGASVSNMLSSFQSSENRAVPQVALQAFAFLSENTAAQTVVASIASDPKVWDAVMENKDLMKFLDIKNSVEADNDCQSEDSSTTETVVSETKPIDLLEILQDMKLKAVRMIENVSSYFGGLFGPGSQEDGNEKKPTFFNDPRSLFGLAVVVIFMVVLKRA